MYPISFFWSNLFQNFYFPLNWEEFFIFHPILKPKEEVFQFVNFVNFSDKIVFSKMLSPLRFQMKRKISWVMVSSVPVNMVFWILQKTFLKKNSCSWKFGPAHFFTHKILASGESTTRIRQKWAFFQRDGFRRYFWLEKSIECIQNLQGAKEAKS